MAGYARIIGMAVGIAAGIILAPETGGASLYASIAIGAAIGGTAGGIIDAVTASKPDSLSERQVQENLSITSAALGTPILIIRGTQTVKGNIIDATLKQPHTIEQDTGGGGGKGGFGGPAQANRTTTYSITLAIGLCEGPINRITKAWTDATLIYDFSQTNQVGEVLNIVVSDGGRDYATGDTGTISGGAILAVYRVDAANPVTGSVATASLVSPGRGYSSLQSTEDTTPTTGNGTGLRFFVAAAPFGPGGQLDPHQFSDDQFKMGLRTRNGCTDVHLHRGTEDQLPCSILQDLHGAEIVQAYRGYAYVVIKDLDLGTSGRVPQFQFEVESAVSNELGAVLTELCDKAGLNTSMIDVNRVPVRHVDFLIANTVAISSVIETLANCYNFIAVESDGKIHFRDKSTAPVTVIPERLLSAGIDVQENKSLQITRTQDRELPTKVTVTYADKTRNFQSAAQVQQLVNPLVATDAPFQFNIPVALLPADAKILAEIVLYEAWSSREQFVFTLPPRYMMIEPGDAVVVEARGLQYPMRIVEWTAGDNWLTEARGVSYDSSLYSAFRPIPGVGGSARVLLPVTAHASGLLFEPPALSTAEVEPRYLFAAYSAEVEKTFVSASLLESQDGGASYNFDLTSSAPAVVGNVASPLPTANWHVWDDMHTIDVVLFQRILQPASEQEVLNGKNWAVLGNEVIAFRDALLIAARTYRLSHLLRGRKGTEAFVGTHGSNEPFVLLSPDLRGTGRIAYPRARIGVSSLYKVIDPVTNVTVAIPFSFTTTGVSVKPWAPVPLTVQHNTPSTNDITIRWLYRSRTRGELVNSSGVMFDLDFTQQFYVNIYTDVTRTVLARQTLTPVFTNANAVLSVVYTAAEQTIDFGSPQATIYSTVFGIGTGSIGYGTAITG